MKKLMIAAAIVCAAAASQAAKINWSTSNTKAGYKSAEGSSDGIAAGFTAYIFDTATISSKGVYDLFMADGGSALAAKAFGTGVTAASKIDSTTTTYGSESTQYTFVAAILATDASGNEYLYITNEKTNTTGGDPSVSSSFLFGSQNSSAGGTFSSQAAKDSWSGNGYWYAAPEPTSGLLLLIGVGALALRRRRA